MSPSQAVAAAIFSLGILAAPARPAAAADARDLLGTLTAPEQRVLHSMRADPNNEAQLKADLRKALADKGDPQRFAAAKARFQVEWLSRINDFSLKYSAQDPALIAGMKALAKPGPEEARRTLDWFAAIDNQNWGGALIPGVIDSLNAYEAAYTLNSMRSFTAAQRQEVGGQLDTAKGWGLGAGSVIPKLVAATQKTYGEDRSDAEGAYGGRSAQAKGELARLEKDLLAKAPPPQTRTELDGSKTAKEQLERTERALEGAKRDAESGGAPDLEGAKGKGGVFDGVGIIGGEPKPDLVVVDAGSSKENPAKLQPPGSAGGDDLNLDEIPPPPAPQGSVASQSGSKLGMMFKSPYVGAGIGGLGLGLLGFFLGGPIGAVIGALAGAAAGYFLVKKLA